MWRKFLGVGIPVLVLGLVFLIIGLTRVTDYLYEDYYYGGGSGEAALMWIGYIFAIIGGMLVNAGLIGAAVGADPRTRARAAALQQPFNLAQPMAVSWAPAVVSTQPGPETQVKSCATCGSENRSSSAFCLQCGAKLGPEA